MKSSKLALQAIRIGDEVACWGDAAAAELGGGGTPASIAQARGCVWWVVISCNSNSEVFSSRARSLRVWISSWDSAYMRPNFGNTWNAVSKLYIAFTFWKLNKGIVTTIVIYFNEFQVWVFVFSFHFFISLSKNSFGKLFITKIYQIFIFTRGF